ncbi:MAG: helix-turn-helix domain-containing protein [Patescibacteria group bacterium]
MFSTKVYTPEQVAEMLQLSKNTVYGLINRGEIIAKKIGNVYRIPARSIAFVFNGLDADLSDAQAADEQNFSRVQQAINAVRAP